LLKWWCMTSFYGWKMQSQTLVRIQVQVSLNLSKLTKVIKSVAREFFFSLFLFFLSPCRDLLSCMQSFWFKNGWKTSKWSPLVLFFIYGLFMEGLKNVRVLRFWKEEGQWHIGLLSCCLIYPSYIRSFIFRCWGSIFLIHLICWRFNWSS